MRKIAAIALVLSLGAASPVMVSERAAAQQAPSDLFCGSNNPCAWPALVAAGSVILAVTIALITAKHHHAVSP